MIINRLLISFLILTLFFSCAKSTDAPVEYEPDVIKRAQKSRDNMGGLFGQLGKNSQKNPGFASSNVLWKATINTLDFIPLASIDYTSGTLVYEWYNDDLNSNDEIKITVNLLNDEVKSESIKVTSFKRTCNVKERCEIKKLGENFNTSIKDKIITTARILKIEETKKNK